MGGHERAGRRAATGAERHGSPFFTATWIAAVNIALVTVCHLLLPARWAVTGMAGAYAVSYLAGLTVTARRLRRRLGGRLDDGALRRTYTKLLCAAALAAVPAWGAARACTASLGTGIRPTAVSLAAGTAVPAAGYLALGRLMKVGELRGVVGRR
ncbi:polysaccharide biosynthesis C-terminal domain-containing protein [Streptomyces massasporeus]